MATLITITTLLFILAGLAVAAQAVAQRNTEALVQSFQEADVTLAVPPVTVSQDPPAVPEEEEVEETLIDEDPADVIILTDELGQPREYFILEFFQTGSGEYVVLLEAEDRYKDVVEDALLAKVVDGLLQPITDPEEFQEAALVFQLIQQMQQEELDSTQDPVVA